MSLVLGACRNIQVSPFPLSLFNEEGMRKGTKSSLFSAFTPTKIDAVQATCPEISQEQFLANERNKVRFIDLLKKFLQKANATVKQAVEDVDVLLVETAVSVKSQYDNIFVVGENIDFLVLLTGLAPMKENLYFQKCGKGRTPDVLYSTTSFKYKFSKRILFIHAFSGCDITNAPFSHEKTKFCCLFEKNRHLEEKIQVFFNFEATIDQMAKAGETFLIHSYEGYPRTSACDLNHLHYTLFTQSATKARSTLARLPPTADAARFHALRSYLQKQ
ncbi:hypothetical protein AVEN_109224-1 [Araneus ventricosus]|uniref:Uncharacterized protein n=1 Tax=Araneus ventricosus TaxID=182803 RepID=A0A4Y2M2M8_ARAVE|nr:hypothetical protein AVEN_109224-1 [Araneus ventricosus]